MNKMRRGTFGDEYANSIARGGSNSTQKRRSNWPFSLQK